MAVSTHYHQIGADSFAFLLQGHARGLVGSGRRALLTAQPKMAQVRRDVADGQASMSFVFDCDEKDVLGDGEERLRICDCARRRARPVPSHQDGAPQRFAAPAWRDQ
jgi:hypothetical protein